MIVKKLLITCGKKETGIMKKFFVKRLVRKFTPWLNSKFTLYMSTVIENVYKVPLTKNKLQNFVKGK